MYKQADPVSLKALLMTMLMYGREASNQKQAIDLVEMCITGYGITYIPYIIQKNF